MSSFARCLSPMLIFSLSATRLWSRILSIISEVSRTTFENVYKVIETVSVSWVVASGIANILEGQIAPSSSDGRGEQDRSDHRSNDHSKARPEKGENRNTERGNDAACLQA